MKRAEIEIFTALGTDGCQLCHPDQSDTWNVIRTLVNGERRADAWLPLAVHLVRSDEGKRLVPCDAPWLGSHALVLGSRAVAVLHDLLVRDGELLPLACNDGPLWMFNPTTRLDALDEGSSKAMRFDDGRIMYIQRHAFRPERLVDVSAFKLTNLAAGPTFLRSSFVDAWQAAGLTGLDFKKIWSMPLS